MENVCIRIKFSPLMKNISKDNSKCTLEIIPLVTCIENIDKIKWKQKKDIIEYIIPMNYKLIIKKIKPNTYKNQTAIKTYYSCVDLLPSSLPNVDVDPGNINKVISDNNVFDKERNNFNALSNMPSIDTKLNQTMQHNRLKATNPNENSILSPMDLSFSDSMLTSDDRSEKLKTGSVQTEKDEEEAILLPRDQINDTHNFNKCISTMIQTDQFSYCNAKTCKNNITNNITPLFENIKSIHTDDISGFGNFRINKRTSYSIPRVIIDEDVFKCYNEEITRINTSAKSFPLHKIHDSFDEEMILISNIRIQPELRVAKFIEKIEKEIMPLQLILDNIINKCSSLGLKYVDNVFSNSLFNTNLNFSSNHFMKQRERYLNRVIYSVVFDK